MTDTPTAIPPKEDPNMRIVQDACLLLRGRFDNVQIFVSRFDPKTSDTSFIHWGDGNTFARYGQVQKWLIMTDNVDNEPPEADQG